MKKKRRLITITSKSLLQALHDAEIIGTLNEVQPNAFYDQILVPLGEDNRGNEITLQIGVLNGPTHPLPSKEQNQEGSTVQFIQFLIVFPIRIEEESYNDTQMLLNLLNAVTELPGFSILEAEKVPFFRHTVVCHDNRIDEDLFILVVGLIMYVIDHHLQAIEDMAKGRRKIQDFNEIRPLLHP